MSWYFCSSKKSKSYCQWHVDEVDWRLIVQTYARASSCSWIMRIIGGMMVSRGAESSLVNSQSGFGGARESWEHWGLCWAKLSPDGVFSLPMPVNPLSCVPVFIKPPCSTMISQLPHGETDTRVDLCRCQNYCSHIWKPLARSLLDPPPDRL